MGRITSLRKGVKALKPFVAAVRGVERDIGADAPIAVVDGEPRTTARLRAILGARDDEPLSDGAGLLVYPAVADHDLALAASVLAGAKREGRRVLAIAIGPADQRDDLERRLLEARPLEASNVAHATGLDDPAPVLAAIVRALGDDVVAISRRHPALREAAADAIIAKAARQAGTVGAAAVLPGSDLPAITLIQVRMVAQLAALHGRPLDARRGLELAGVMVSALGWRAVARRARTAVPVAGFAVRGGLGYSATRGIGQAARTWFAQAGDKADQPLEGLNDAIAKTLSRRGRR